MLQDNCIVFCLLADLQQWHWTQRCMYYLCLGWSILSVHAVDTHIPQHLCFVLGFILLAFLPPSEGGVFSWTQSCVLCRRDGHGTGLPPLSGHRLQVNALKQALLAKSLSRFSPLVLCSFSCPLMILTWSTLSHAWKQQRTFNIMTWHCRDNVLPKSSDANDKAQRLSVAFYSRGTENKLDTLQYLFQIGKSHLSWIIPVSVCKWEAFILTTRQSSYLSIIKNNLINN